MNPNIETAVANINAERNKAIEAKIALHMQNIDVEQKSSAIAQKVIEEQRAELLKISSDVFTIESSAGGPLPEGPNKETLVKVINDINKGRQGAIEAQAHRVVSHIAKQQEVIRKAGESIAKNREEIAKLKVDLITATEVVGS